MFHVANEDEFGLVCSVFSTTLTLFGSRSPYVFVVQSGKNKDKEEKVEERVTLGPKVAEGENVFGVAHIFASFNDTFVVRNKDCFDKDAVTMVHNAQL